MNAQRSFFFHFRLIKLISFEKSNSPQKADFIELNKTSNVEKKRRVCSLINFRFSQTTIISCKMPSGCFCTQRSVSYARCIIARLPVYPIQFAYILRIFNNLRLLKELEFLSLICTVFIFLFLLVHLILTERYSQNEDVATDFQKFFKPYTKKYYVLVIVLLI